MVNITKSQPPPICLEQEKQKRSGDYKCGCVLERLKKDFHNKCYICEEMAPSSINVEHFIPHKGDIDLMFDWKNLFYACPHCNNTKSDVYMPMLDCTNPEHPITSWLKFDLVSFPKEKIIITAQHQNKETENTRQLLLDVYNGKTKLKEIEAGNLREKLSKDLVKFQELLKDYYADDVDEQEKKILHKKIKREITPVAAFSAFKLWVVKNNTTYSQEFL